MQPQNRNFHLKKGDIVSVLAGKEKGKTGKVLRVICKKNRAVVEKVNMVKKHLKPGAQTGQGGILEKEASIHISNLMVICSKCTDPTRVGKKILEDGKKVRYCKKCGEFLDD